MDGLGLTDLPERVAAAVSRRVVEALDVDGIAQRIDVAAIAQRIDVDAMASRIDVAALLARIDVDALLARVDLAALLARIDINAVLEEVDLDALLARVDLDTALERVDLAPLLLRAGLPDLIAEGTGQVAGSALDVARRQLVGIDALVLGSVDRLGRRDPEAIPAAPGGLSGEPMRADHLPPRVRGLASANVSGHYAGPVSRLLQFGLDYGAILLSFTAVTAVTGYAVRVVTGIDVDHGRSGAIGAVLLGAWAFLYWWLALDVAGRTPGMAVLGLRAVRSDGRPISAGRAAVRVLLMPVSAALLGLGLIGAVVDPRRRTLHDAVSGTAVVYDWGDRPAELPSPLAAWLTRREPGPS